MCTTAGIKCIHTSMITSETWIKWFDSYGFVYDRFINFLKCQSFEWILEMFHKNILICVLNMNKNLMGLEQEGELTMTFYFIFIYFFGWTKLLISVCDRHVTKEDKIFKKCWNPNQSQVVWSWLVRRLIL